MFQDFLKICTISLSWMDNSLTSSAPAAIQFFDLVKEDCVAGEQGICALIHTTTIFAMEIQYQMSIRLVFCTRDELSMRVLS